MATYTLSDAISRKDIMTVDELRPGMKGYSKSVFKGTEIETFAVTVIGVMEKSDFDFDLILVRVESGTVIERKSGIIGGMSGSPVYINDKLIGSIAYGWTYSKEPIAGVQPIVQMLEAFDPKLSPIKSKSVVHLKSKFGPMQIGKRHFMDAVVSSDPPAINATSDSGPLVLTPVATPLIVNGLGRSATDYLRHVLKPYNITVMEGVGGGSGNTRVDMEPGAAMGVALMTGDIDATGVGTVTYVEGDKVIGFGHPMFGIGPVEFPLMNASIVDIMPSVMRSNKLSTTGAIRGTLTQDRPFSVGGLLGRKCQTVPIEIAIKSARGVSHRYNVNVINNPLFTNQLIYSNILGALSTNVPSSAEGTTQMKLLVKPQGLPPIERTNVYVRGNPVIYGGSPLDDATEILESLSAQHFQEVVIERVVAKFEATSKAHVYYIDEISARKQRFKPGESVPVWIRLISKKNKEQKIITAELDIPKTAPPGILRFALSGGSTAMRMRQRVGALPPRPRNINQLIRWLKKLTYRGNELVYMSSTMTNGVEFSGEPLHSLPASVTGALFSLGSSEILPLREIREKRIPTNFIVQGSAFFTVNVEADEKENEGAPAPPPSGGGSPPPQRPTGGINDMANLINAPETRSLFHTEGLTAGERLVETVKRARMKADKFIRPSIFLAEPFSPLMERKPLVVHPTDRALFPVGTPRPSHNEETPQKKALDQESPPSMPDWDEVEALDENNLHPNEDGDSEESKPKRAEALARAPSHWVMAKSKDFKKGEFEGTLVTSKDQIKLAPSLTQLSSYTEVCVWATSSDLSGGAYFGTWKPARLRHIDADGRNRLLATLPDDVGVTSIVVNHDGTVFFATLPLGHIYKWTSDDGVALVSKISQPYPWALALRKNGNLLVGAGPTATLFEIADGQVNTLFSNTERHIMAVTVNSDGAAFFGTNPRGKVYRLGLDNSISPVFQTPKDTVQSLAVDAKGNLYIGTSSEGRIYIIRSDGNGEELLKLAQQHVFSLAPGPGPWVYAGTGSRRKARRGQTTSRGINGGHIYKVFADGTVVELGDPKASHVLAMTHPAKGQLIAVTNGSEPVVKLAKQESTQGTYLSPIHDCTSIARFGLLRWMSNTRAGTRITLQTRTGNTAYPDSHWSDWSTQHTDPDGESVKSTPGRYIQYRANLFSGNNGASPILERVDLLYLKQNSSPELTVREPSAGDFLSKEVVLRWEAKDPDKDKLIFEAAYSSDDGKTWEKIHESNKTKSNPKDNEKGGDASNKTASTESSNRKANGKSATPTTTKNNLKWDTRKVQDGTYHVRVLASDRMANPNQAKEDTIVLRPIIVDNSEPIVLINQRTGLTKLPTSIRCFDKTSYISSAEYRIDNNEWFAATCEDQIFDNHYETIIIDEDNVIKNGKYTLHLRVRDAAGNVKTEKLEYGLPSGNSTEDTTTR